MTVVENKGFCDCETVFFFRGRFSEIRVAGFQESMMSAETYQCFLVFDF